MDASVFAVPVEHGCGMIYPPHATHFSRQGEKWVRSDYGDLNASIVLSIGCSLTLTEIYAAVQFE